MYRSLRRPRVHQPWATKAIKAAPGPRDWSVLDVKPPTPKKKKGLTLSERFLFGLGLMTAVAILGSIAFVFLYVLVGSILAHVGSHG